MGHYNYTERDGYEYVSDAGIVYDLCEGKSLLGETTSDIIFIILSDKDAVFTGIEYVGFMYGAMLMTDMKFKKEALRTFDKYANDYEQKHPEVVEYYGDNNMMMMKEIQKTVKSYLITNREVLDDYQIKKIEKQIKFLDAC